MRSIVNLCLLSIFLLNAGQATGQKSVRSIVSQLKEADSYEGISIPGWLVRLGSSFAAKHDDELRESGIAELIRKVRHIRIAKAKVGHRETSDKMPARFIKSLQEDGFEEYVRVRDEDQHFNLFVRQQGNQIKNLVLFSNEGGEMSLIHIKTRWTPEDLASISLDKLTQNVSSSGFNTLLKN